MVSAFILKIKKLPQFDIGVEILIIMNYNSVYLRR